MNCDENREVLIKEQNNAITIVEQAERNNSTEDLELLKQCAEINEVDEKGYSALYYARKKETVTALLDAGIDINHQNNEGKTILHYLMEYLNRKENLPVIFSILEMNPDMSIRDKNGKTARDYYLEKIDKLNKFYSLKYEYWESVLMPYMTNSLFDDIEKLYGKTVKWYNREAVLELVAWLDEHKEHYDMFDEDGNNLFMIAARNNSATLMKAIAERYPEQVNAKNHQGQNAFGLISKTKPFTKYICVLLMDENELLVKDPDDEFKTRDRIRYYKKRFYDMNPKNCHQIFDPVIKEHANVEGVTDYLSGLQIMFECTLKEHHDENGTVIPVNIEVLRAVLNSWGPDCFDIWYETFIKSGFHLKDMIFKSQQIDAGKLKNSDMTFADYLISDKNCAMAIIKTLQAEGVNINEPNESGYYLFNFFIKNATIKFEEKDSLKNIFSMFSIDGLEAIDADGWSAFHYAAYYELSNVINALIELGVDYTLCNVEDDKTKYFIVKSALSDSIEDNIKLLHDLGLDINYQNADGETLLLAFCVRESSDSSIIRNLLNIPNIDVNIRNKNGNTALALILHRGCNIPAKEKAELLLDAGADPRIPDEKGNDALYYIAQKGYEDLMPHIKRKYVEEAANEGTAEEESEQIKLDESLFNDILAELYKDDKTDEEIENESKANEQMKNRMIKSFADLKVDNDSLKQITAMISSLTYINDQKAKDEFEKSCASYNEEAKKLKENGDIKGLMKLSAEYIKKDPSYLPALLNLQGSYVDLGQYKAAYNLYNTINALDSKNNKNIVNAMAAVLGMGNVDEFKNLYAYTVEKKIRSMGIIYQFLMKEQIKPSVPVSMKINYITSTLKLCFENIVLGEKPTMQKKMEFYDRFDVYSFDNCNIQMEATERAYMSKIYSILAELQASQQDFAHANMASEISAHTSEQNVMINE